MGKFAGTWPMPSSKAWQILPKPQEKEVFGSGQVSFTDCGSASGNGSVPELGRAQSRHLGSGCSNRTGPGPTLNNSSSLHELGSCGPTCSEVVEKGVGLSQELLLRSPLQPNYKCSNGNEGNVTHNWEVGENREDLSQENDCLKIHKYDDNLYEQSPSSLISVFGRPLLPGGISGLRGINEDEDLEPLRVVAADVTEWGVDFSGALIEEGEGLGAVGQRTKEAQNESSELWTYERWENSYLAKFSDFLGFPT